MKDFKILKIIDLFSFFYRVMGINYEIMRKILQIKLLMDQRRVPAVLVNSKSKNNENAFNKSLLMYGFVGIIFMIFIFLPLPLFLKMNFTIGMIIFMVTLTMVSDFSAILLDVKDKTILLSKPINLKTVNAAKITHIIINLLTIMFVMAGPSLMAGLSCMAFCFLLYCFANCCLSRDLFFSSLHFFIFLFFCFLMVTSLRILSITFKS